MENLYEILNNAETLVTAETTVEKNVLETYKRLTEKLFDFYKGGKGTKNIAEFISENSDYIKHISNNIGADSVKIVRKGNYLRIELLGERIAQLSLGNAKLSPNNKNGSGFVLWSILGGITCEGATSLCKSYCYNNGKSFTNTLMLKASNTVLTFLECFDSIMSKALENAPYIINVIRVHEDGDFYSTEYFKAWKRVADEMKNHIFGAYTKNSDLLDECVSNANFTMRFSVMHDTDTELVKYVQDNNLLYYNVLGTKRNDLRASELFDLLPKKVQCINDCSKCKKCYFGNEQGLFNKIH